MRKKVMQLISIIALVTIYIFLIVSCKKDDNIPTTIMDADGNIYSTVNIGSQIWMTENLKTTKYNDGTNIPNISEDLKNYSNPGYCWYNNNESANKNTYGALYNWYAVNTGKLCPTGWHVPTKEDWTILTDYLGGQDVAGGKLKETGPSHWEFPNALATNETGFTALPGGYLREDAAFATMGKYGYWWSNTESDTQNAEGWILFYDKNRVSNINTYKTMGFSIRCVKD